MPVRVHPGLRLAPVLAAILSMTACDWSSPVPEGLHDGITVSNLIGQQVMSCDDGARLDIDFLNDGLDMAVTPLSGGRTEHLHAKDTGTEFRGEHLEATLAGTSIAFTLPGGTVRICHRADERE